MEEMIGPSASLLHSCDVITRKVYFKSLTFCGKSNRSTGATVEAGVLSSLSELGVCSRSARRETTGFDGGVSIPNRLSLDLKKEF